MATDAAIIAKMAGKAFLLFTLETWLKFAARAKRTAPKAPADINNLFHGTIESTAKEAVITPTVKAIAATDL